MLGGFAFQIHGVPRPTFDVDVTLSAEQERVAALLRTMEAEGAIVDEAFRRGWADSVAGMRKISALLPVSGRLVAADLFLVRTPFQRSAFERRVAHEVEGRGVPFATAEDLLLFKLIANRHKDRADAVDLLAFAGLLDAS